jgi:AAA+ ATPase superfamily predicted ATPase
MTRFVNRVAQLASLEQWWNGTGGVAAVAGRRRVGKTWLALEFSRDKLVVFHRGAGRGDQGELHHLALAMVDEGWEAGQPSDLAPFAGWTDALERLEEQARQLGRPVLLVLDNASALLTTELTEALVARTARSGAGGGPCRPLVKVLLCTSSIRQVEALRQPGGALGDVLDELVLVEPFTPAEAGQKLPALSPAHRPPDYWILACYPLNI